MPPWSDMQDFDVYIVDLYITCGGKAVNIKWRVDKTYMDVQMSKLRRDALPLSGDACSWRVSARQSARL
jgi:hypothetical protein